MEINNINNKIINQLDLALKELEIAKSNTYNWGDLARAGISKAEGILETIKTILE